MSLHFIDIASHQAGINLGGIPGLGGVIIKATEATGYVNPYCDQHMREAAALGLCRGVYHFAGSSGDKRLEDPEAEWAFFRDQTAGYRGDAIPVLDFEPFGYSNANVAQSVAWVHTWADACRRDWGVYPVIYMARYHVNQWGNAGADIAANCGLWLAEDTGLYNARMLSFDPPAPPAPAGWTLFGWQYCANGALGGVSPVDMDIAFVDASGWQSYATGDGTHIATQTPSKKEDDEMYVLTCTNKGIRTIYGGEYRQLPSDEFVNVVNDKLGDTAVYITCNDREFDILTDVLTSGEVPASVDVSPILAAIKQATADLGLSDEAIAAIVEAVAKVDATAVAGQLEVGVKA